MAGASPASAWADAVEGRVYSGGCVSYIISIHQIALVRSGAGMPLSSRLTGLAFRNVPPILFRATTDALAPVDGFGWLLISMDLA